MGLAPRILPGQPKGPKQYEHQDFPARMWAPDGSQSEIFETEAKVPDGWLPRHPTPEEIAKAQKSPGVVKTETITRDQTIQALNEAGIRFNARADTATLLTTLEAAARDAIAKKGLPISESATIVDLLRQLGSKVL